MAIISVPIAVPEGMAPFLNTRDNDHAFKQNAMLLFPYIQDLTISHGRAAEILGVNKLDLIDFYCGLGIPYLDQSVSELEEDLATLKRLKEKNT